MVRNSRCNIPCMRSVLCSDCGPNKAQLLAPPGLKCVLYKRVKLDALMALSGSPVRMTGLLFVLFLELHPLLQDAVLQCDLDSRYRQNAILRGEAPILIPVPSPTNRTSQYRPSLPAFSRETGLHARPVFESGGPKPAEDAARQSQLSRHGAFRFSGVLSWAPHTHQRVRGQHRSAHRRHCTARNLRSL